MVKERDDLVYLAKLAEQAERFDEMVSARPGGGVGGGRRARRPDGAPDGPDGARSRRARSSTGAEFSRAGPEPAPAEPEPAPAEPEPEPPRAATMRAKKPGRGRTREKQNKDKNPRNACRSST